MSFTNRSNPRSSRSAHLQQSIETIVTPTFEVEHFHRNAIRDRNECSRFSKMAMSAIRVILVLCVLYTFYIGFFFLCVNLSMATKSLLGWMIFFFVFKFAIGIVALRQIYIAGTSESVSR